MRARVPWAERHYGVGVGGASGAGVGAAGGGEAGGAASFRFTGGGMPDSVPGSGFFGVVVAGIAGAGFGSGVSSKVVR